MADEKLLKEIGDRIKSTRKLLRMTQEELAEKMDVSIQMISNLELGKKAVRPENIIKLCDALDISADYILRGKKSYDEEIDFLEKYRNLTLEKQQLIDELIKAMS